MKATFLRIPLAVWLAAVSTGTGAVTVNIDSAEIDLPAPAGFEDRYNSGPQMREFGDTITHRTSQMLAFFVPKDADLVEGFDNYMFVQTPRGYEDRDFSASQFLQVREDVRQGHDRVDDIVQGMQSELDRLASQQTGVNVRTQLRDTKSLGIFMDRPEAIGYSLLQKQKFEVSGIAQENVQVIASLTLHINSKIVYVDLYRTLYDQTDVAVAQNTARNWAEAIITANATALGDGGDTSNTDNSLDMAILGILFILAFGFFRHWYDNRRR